MPWWSGCKRLAPGELLLLSFGGLAFDGRDFGVDRASALVGRAALRRLRDPAGRPMPWWSGCTRLAPGELFLLSFEGLAFDGRYFGITRASELVGRASRLWPR